jgi:protein subunit release factor B
MKKDLAFSVTKDDCEWQEFRVGGAGGQHRDKTSAGIRVTHPPSGATGRATDSRSQLQNRRNAFKRMTQTVAFKTWVTRQLANGPTVEERVEKDMQPENLLIEGRESGTWAPIE